MSGRPAPERPAGERTVAVGDLEMRTAHDGGADVVALAGELDLASAQAVERELGRLAHDGDRPLVVDLAELTFIDSTGVRLLLSATRARDGGLVVRRPPPRVRRVLQLAGVEALLRISD